jgi:hypothetical protein
MGPHPGRSGDAQLQLSLEQSAIGVNMKEFAASKYVKHARRSEFRRARGVSRARGWAAATTRRCLLRSTPSRGDVRFDDGWVGTSRFAAGSNDDDEDNVSTCPVTGPPATIIRMITPGDAPVRL